MPAENRSKIEKYYDRLSASYDKTHAEGYFESINSFELSALEGPVSNKKILEVGCGTGLVLSRIAKKASAAYGIDLSFEMLRKSRGRSLDVVQADALKLPFKDSSFDVVYSVKVLPHIPMLKQAFGEMARVTKKGGLVFFELYNSHSAKSLLKKAFPTKTFTLYYSLGELKQMLPPEIELIDSKGIMVFTPSCVLYSVPLLGKALGRLESIVSGTFLKKFASHVILVCRKK